MKKLLAVLVLGLFIAPSAHAAFDTDLRYGSSGSPVLELQEFLTTQGVYSGPITGNFYSLTLAGVKALQTRLNVSPQSGFFGPLTRASANAILSTDLKESDAEASSTPVVNVARHTVSTSNIFTISTGGSTVQTSSIFSTNGTASTTLDGVYFTFVQHVDYAHFVIKDENGEPGGMGSEKVGNNMFKVGWTTQPGTYTWVADVYQFGPSKQWHSVGDPKDDGVHGTASGSFTIE